MTSAGPTASNFHIFLLLWSMEMWNGHTNSGKLTKSRYHTDFQKKEEKMWYFDILGNFGHFLTGRWRRPKNFKFLYFSEFWAWVSLKMYMLQFTLLFAHKWIWVLNKSKSIFESKFCNLQEFFYQMSDVIGYESPKWSKCHF